MSSNLEQILHTIAHSDITSKQIKKSLMQLTFSERYKLYSFASTLFEETQDFKNSETDSITYTFDYKLIKSQDSSFFEDEEEIVYTEFIVNDNGYHLRPNEMFFDRITFGKDAVFALNEDYIDTLIKFNNVVDHDKIKKIVYGFANGNKTNPSIMDFNKLGFLSIQNDADGVIFYTDDEIYDKTYVFAHTMDFYSKYGNRIPKGYSWIELIFFVCDISQGVDCEYDSIKNLIIPNYVAIYNHDKFSIQIWTHSSKIYENNYIDVEFFSKKKKDFYLSIMSDYCKYKSEVLDAFQHSGDDDDLIWHNSFEVRKISIGMKNQT